MNTRAYWGAAFAALLFLLVQLGAVALVPTFSAAGYQTVENPANPTNSLLYLGAILVMTGVMLAAFKFDFDWAIRGLIIFTSGLLAWYVFNVLVPPLVAVALAALVSLALFLYPEWYVIDASGVLMGAGAAGLFGISFGLLPAIVLLTILAVYDAISVYGTEHMLDLAEGVMDLNIPVVLVIPLSLSYSTLRDEKPDVPRRDDAPEAGTVEEDEVAADGAAADGAAADGVATDADAADGVATDADAADGDAADGTADDAPEGNAEREAFFIGLGDAVIPTVLVASAAFFSPAPTLGLPFLLALNLPALLAMVGTMLGLGFLLWAVMKGRPHAGLPLLNGGALAGYLVGSLVAGMSLASALGIASYV
jgi:presenilin-like A22 family membrane protease